MKKKQPAEYVRIKFLKFMKILLRNLLIQKFMKL